MQSPSPFSITTNSLLSLPNLANFYAADLARLASLLPIATRRLRSLHSHILTSGYHPRAYIFNRLIDLYSKSGDLTSARHLFNQTPHKDVIARTTLINAYSNSKNHKLARKIFDSTPLYVRDTVFYNAMISGYSRTCEGHLAIKVFRDMLQERFHPDNYTFTGVLSAAVYLIDLCIGHCRQLHCLVVKYGTGKVVSVSNALIALYMKCEPPEAAESARDVFGGMQERDELTWTTIVVGYVRRGDIGTARQVFDEMGGRFDVVWNAMISGYVHHERFSEALEMFRRMYLDGLPLDEFTYTSVLSACANAGLFNYGKAVHAHIIRTGPDFNPDSALPVENVLVTLYSKCGNLKTAKRVFEDIKIKDSVSWNAILTGYVNSGCINDAWDIFENTPVKNHLSWMVMISGLVQNGRPEEAVKLFNRLRGEDVKPCDYTYAGALAACGDMGALQHGRQLHAQLLQLGYESSNSAGNALLTMYAKCGAVQEAQFVFTMMPNLDSVSWNAMIAALGHHGHGVESLELFDRMIVEGIHPDRISFLTVLSACNHAGLVDEGFWYFESMERDYGISPEEDHYARLIDLLGRAGQITEARVLINSMPFTPGPSIWEAVLAGCRIHGDMDIGIHAAEQLLSMTPKNDGAYILLSNIYAAVGKWEGVARVRKLMKERGVKKEPGCSWIEVANKVHVFLVNDTMHPNVQEIYNFLEVIGAKMRKLGYVPDTRFVLHDVESGQKEYVLSTHSEKLAIAFGLLYLPTGATPRVLKNLRICGDCHMAIIFMSIAVGREIIVRDGKRFHHFKNGECSCGNYW